MVVSDLVGDSSCLRCSFPSLCIDSSISLCQPRLFISFFLCVSLLVSFFCSVILSLSIHTPPFQPSLYFLLSRLAFKLSINSFIVVLCSVVLPLLKISLLEIANKCARHRDLHRHLCPSLPFCLACVLSRSLRFSCFLVLFL